MAVLRHTDSNDFAVQGVQRREESSGAVTLVKVRNRCGFKPWRFQMRRTEASLTPLAWAMLRVLQWVASAGFSCVVKRMISCTCLVEICGLRLAAKTWGIFRDVAHAYVAVAISQLSLTTICGLVIEHVTIDASCFRSSGASSFKDLQSLSFLCALHKCPSIGPRFWVRILEGFSIQFCRGQFYIGTTPPRFFN